jgi:hypothetical protein
MRCLHLSTAFGVLFSVGSAHAAAQSTPSSPGPVLPTRQLVDGVVVLQHRAGAFERAPQWSLAPAPLATAGGPAAPDYDLTYARAVEILSDGRLVTLAPVGNRLFVFAPDGRGEKSLGREGKGPGEIMAPGGMSRTTGDTLVIPDAANNRLNWLVATKGFVAEVPLPAIVNGHFVRPVGALRTGELVMSTAGLVQTATADTLTRPPASVVLIAPKAVNATVIATLPDLELMRIPTNYRGRAGMETMPLRFGRNAMAVAWDTVIATGSGDGYRIDLRDATGRVRSSLRVPVPRRPVSRAMRDSAIAAAIARFDAPSAERMVDRDESRRIERVRPVADSLPPYGNWFVSPNRTLWVVDTSAPGDVAGGATAFRQDGTIIARLTWSRQGQPVAFGDDRVVMRDVDEDGVVALRVFRIQPRAR